MRPVAVAIAVGFALAAAPAQAGAPLRFTDEFDFADTIDCKQFNPEWTFHDDFHDFFKVRAKLWLDANGDPIREIDWVHHVSNDVNSVTEFTLHEHNHFTVTIDFIKGTVTLNGAIGIMQRRGVGEVIHATGHKIFDAETGDPLVIRGPDIHDDEAFCAALAP